MNKNINLSHSKKKRKYRKKKLNLLLYSPYNMKDYLKFDLWSKWSVKYALHKKCNFKKFNE